MALLRKLVVAASFLVVPAGLSALSVACGGGGGATSKPAENAGQTTAVGEKAPKVILEDSTEVWYDDESGPATPAGSASKTREYYRDVTKASTIKGTNEPPVIKKLRVVVRFPVPKVTPKDAREPHVVNRLLWEVRAQMAACFYKGAGKEPTPELTMVGVIDLNNKGEITSAVVEKADEGLKKGAVDECILENVKGLAFAAAGDATKIRFKLKLQTVDGSALPDFEATPVK